MQNPYLCIGFCGKLYPCPADFVNIAAAILYICTHAKGTREAVQFGGCMACPTAPTKEKYLHLFI